METPRHITFYNNNTIQQPDYITNIYKIVKVVNIEDDLSSPIKKTDHVMVNALCSCSIGHNTGIECKCKI